MDNKDYKKYIIFDGIDTAGFVLLKNGVELKKGDIINKGDLLQASYEQGVLDRFNIVKPSEQSGTPLPFGPVGASIKEMVKGAVAKVKALTNSIKVW